MFLLDFAHVWPLGEKGGKKEEDEKQKRASVLILVYNSS
jgi:hypothetical protein